jgi:SAM-dependent methyltransferase
MTLPVATLEPYVLGANDLEISRLALQHQVWRPRALDAWKRADFGPGQTILDVGCGPGYSALDLAEIVGPTGSVVAIDSSIRFLDVLDTRRCLAGLQNIALVQLDLNESSFPIRGDGAWCRWVFAFVRRPRQLLGRIADALKPGAVLVIHEYFDYATWRTAPRCTRLETFTRLVMDDWRDRGGEPDIGWRLAEWLPEYGFRTASMRPMVDVVTPASYLWEWQKSFLKSGLRQLVQTGRLTREESSATSQAFADVEGAPNALMITPGVLEIIAVLG